MASITKRTNKDGTCSYRIKVFKGKDKTGKALKPYSMTWKPAPTMTPKQIEKELNKQAAKFEEECKTGLVGDATKVTLELFSSQYLDAMQTKLSPVVYDSYKKIINNTIIPALGHIKLNDLKSIHIQEFIKILSNMPFQNRDGSYSQTGKKISPATIRRKLAVLQSMLTFALKLGCISYNPADARRLTLPKVPKKEIEIFTKQEASHILECLKNEPLQFQALIQLAIYSGAREGELVGLKFSDIDFINHKITISRSAYKIKGEPIKTKPPKSNKDRTISINDTCLSLLRSLLAQHSAEAQKLGAAWQGDKWVFTQWNGEIMHPQTPSRLFTKFLAKYDIPHRKFHSLRHTSATLLLYGGTDLKTVQERLGHADFTTTNKYLHLVEQADYQAVNLLENMLNKQQA